MNIPGIGDASARLDQLEADMGAINIALVTTNELLTEIRDLLLESGGGAHTGRLK